MLYLPMKNGVRTRVNLREGVVEQQDVKPGDNFVNDNWGQVTVSFQMKTDIDLALRREYRQAVKNLEGLYNNKLNTLRKMYERAT